MPQTSAIKRDVQDSFRKSLLAKKVHGTYHKDNDSEELFDQISRGLLSLVNAAYILSAQDGTALEISELLATRETYFMAIILQIIV